MSPLRPRLALVRPAALLVAATLMVAATLIVAGCAKPEPIPIAALDFSKDKDYDKPLPPGQLALRKITDPSQIPDFSDAFYNSQSGELIAAIDRSLHYLSKKSSQRYFPYGDVSHQRAVDSLILFKEVLAQARSPEELNALIRQKFDVYISVGCDDRGTMLYTGYYTPIFDGSKTKTAQFTSPIYKLPNNFQKDIEGNPVGGPWKTRQEIESSGVCAGRELVWVDDPFKAYVVTVQGSGQIRMADGRIFEIGYAGNNGHDYKSIGREMVKDGKISKDQLSLNAMLDYFAAHPDQINEYCWRNERYVFFQPAPGGPFGCLNEKVSTNYSIATDKDVFPRACLAFLDATSIPSDENGARRPYKGFALDQDRGAAIRAAGRCDIFMGVGDAAGKRAGFTYNEGKLYYLFVKDANSPPPPPPPAIASKDTPTKRSKREASAERQPADTAPRRRTPPPNDEAAEQEGEPTATYDNQPPAADAKPSGEE